MAAVGARVTVTTSPTVLDQTQANVASIALMVRNRGSVTVDLGGAAVAAGAGYRLEPGEGVTIRAGAYGGGIYAITASGTAVCDVLQLGV